MTNFTKNTRHVAASVIKNSTVFHYAPEMKVPEGLGQQAQDAFKQATHLATSALRELCNLSGRTVVQANQVTAEHRTHMLQMAEGMSYRAAPCHACIGSLVYKH